MGVAQESPWITTVNATRELWAGSGRGVPTGVHPLAALCLGLERAEERSWEVSQPVLGDVPRQL